jgi:drug/metabolite transporter (DMT)-like permease
MQSGILERPAEGRGFVFGFLGVLGFSLTLPVTRVAVAELDPTFVALGRALVAALLAAIALRLTRQSWPGRNHLAALGLVAAGVVIGFPLLSAWALTQVHASHGAVMLGVLPLATAIAGVLRAGERPSWAFWIASGIGSALVIGFALASGAGQLQIADAALIGAVAAAALGYAEGGRLARTLGGWQVICWALVLAAPILILPVGASMALHGLQASRAAWAGFAYLSVISMFLAFFAWYHGLALGGIARVGQVQLLQPFLTLGASALLLHEVVTAPMLVVAAAVAVVVLIGRKARVQRGNEPIKGCSVPTPDP